MPRHTLGMLALGHMASQLFHGQLASELMRQNLKKIADPPR